jgi:hypothetical protein
MHIKLMLRHDAGWLDPNNAGKVFEGTLLKREPSHLPGVEWITVEHPIEMLYGFRSDIIEILELKE